MTQTNTLRVSIVIPVYNEAAHLAACLDAIAKQSVKPYEVIVIDNNSTDDTFKVAAAYSFVTILQEPRQGVVYARDRGFDAATGEIIGRLDADSRIDEDWVATLIEVFTVDIELSAVTGKVNYYGLAMSGLLDRIDLKVRRRLARLLGRDIAMQGANMAIRRSAWLQVSDGLCRRGNLHEDFDVSIHLTKHDHVIKFDESLSVAIDCRRLEATWSEFCAYAWLSPSTYAQHNVASRRYMYPIVLLVVVCYLPLKLLHRGYNASTGRFSWRLAIQASQLGRVNPATFVD